MTCAEFQRRLSAYIDGELPRWTRWKVELHLHRCPECEALHHALREVDAALLDAAYATPAPEYLTGAVMFRLPAMPPARRLSLGGPGWVTAVALAVVQAAALGGAYWLGIAHGSHPHGIVSRLDVAAPGVPLPSSVLTTGREPTAAPGAGVWSRTGTPVLYSGEPASGARERVDRRKGPPVPAVRLQGAFR